MKYARILLTVASEIWAMREDKLLAIVDFLRLQASGQKLTTPEIEARIGKRQEDAVAQAEGAIAILQLRGVIANRMSMMDDVSGGTSVEAFAKAFQAAVRSSDIKAIAIDVDSPGGTVAGSDELSPMIFAARGTKPIIAHVNAVCASAAYWIATAADEIVVTRTGEVGSIGVLTVHEDISKMLGDLGVTETIVRAGKYKAELNPYEPLGDEARAYLQARVDEAYDLFTATVARNRGTTPEAVRGGYGQGRMVPAPEAVRLGMADRIATLEETLQRFGASQFVPASRPKTMARERERRALDLSPTP